MHEWRVERENPVDPVVAILALLGIVDVAGKYYVPKMGPFVIYTMMIVILIWRPNGLFGRTAAR